MYTFLWTHSCCPPLLCSTGPLFYISWFALRITALEKLFFWITEPFHVWLTALLVGLSLVVVLPHLYSLLYSTPYLCSMWFRRFRDGLNQEMMIKQLLKGMWNPHPLHCLKLAAVCGPHSKPLQISLISSTSLKSGLHIKVLDHPRGVYTS